MTAEEGRAIEGQSGRIDAITKYGYPVSLVGKVVLSDSYWLLFETSEEVPIMFSLRKVTKFTPIELKCLIS